MPLAVQFRSCFVPDPLAHRVFNDEVGHLKRHELYYTKTPLAAVFAISDDNRLIDRSGLTILRQMCLLNRQQHR